MRQVIDLKRNRKHQATAGNVSPTAFVSAKFSIQAHDFMGFFFFGHVRPYLRSQSHAEMNELSTGRVRHAA